MNKKYYFITDYTTKYGTIKKGQSLTGRLWKATSRGTQTTKVMFDFYEITDPAKAEAGEGIFSINETDLKNIATDVAPTTEKATTETAKTEDDKKESELKGFKSWSTTKKTMVIGGSLALVGLAVWFFKFRKNRTLL